jgi:hypothetical protein
MQQLIVVIAVVALSLQSTAALKCYNCVGDSCGPSETCDNAPSCTKVVSTAGMTVVTRACGSRIDKIGCKTTGPSFAQIITCACNDKDLCNNNEALTAGKLSMFIISAAAAIFIHISG